MLIIEKNSKKYLSYKLHSDEFKCKCNYTECRATIICSLLSDAWWILRRELNVPLIVNSGYRCQRHNMDIGGSELSRHTCGQAIDIDYTGKLLRTFTPDEVLKTANASGFKWMKYYKEKMFFHLDVRRQ